MHAADGFAAADAHVSNVMKSHYLNTDLVVRFNEPFDDLVAYFKDNAELMMYGKWGDDLWQATINAKYSGVFDDPGSCPERDIKEILSAIESMPNNEREIWIRCSHKELNIGWDSAPGRPEGAFELSNKVLQNVADNGLFIGVTIYPSDENDS